MSGRLGGERRVQQYVFLMVRLVVSKVKELLHLGVQDQIEVKGPLYHSSFLILE